MTRMTCNRLTSLATAAAVIFGLAACGRGLQASDPTTPPTVNTSPPTAPPTTAAAPTTTAAPQRPSATIDELVAVGSAEMHLHCDGRGDHTVLLIAGFTDDRTAFGSIEAGLTATSRVCSYDRFGTGTSDAPPSAQTFATQAADLHELLGGVNEVGPYVVVGHSFGGDVAITFTSMFPGDVRGLLLLEASPATWSSAICGVSADGSATAASFVAACTMQSDSTNNIEGIAGPTAFAELAQITSLGDIPMIVDTAAQHDYAADGMDPTAAAQLTDIWNTGQARWTSLSSAAQLVTVDRSGHYIQLDRPDLVIDQIAELNG